MFYILRILLFCGVLFQLRASEKVSLSINNNDDVTIIDNSNSRVTDTKVMIEQDCDYMFKDENAEVELFRLQNLNPVEIPIKGLPLFAVIKLCAESAGMNYLAPDKDDFSDIVSLNVHSSTFDLLELLAETYCFKMEYKSGIWRFYRINLNELITCFYQLKYNTNEMVLTNSPNINLGLNKNSPNSNILSEQNIFEKQTHELSQLIQKILDMPSTDLHATVSDISNTDGLSKSIAHKFIPKASTQSNPVKGNFFFSSDNNILTVTATRQQHTLIAAYLKTIDKPQKLIKIQSLIVETNKNPQKDFGIDWSKAGKAELSLKNINSTKNKISDIAKSYLMPDIATLSMQDMSIALNFLQKDNQSTILQDPVVVTTNNREVSLKSVTQQPIEIGTSSSTTATTSNTSNSIEYVEIGTLINIYPKIINGGIEHYANEAVKMDISIVISSQIGIQEIDGNNYPIVSSRTYTYSIVIPSGYTLAIGGLSESAEHLAQNKLPILGDIPGIGWLFRANHKSKGKRNLLAFITPTIINSACTGEVIKHAPLTNHSPFEQLYKINTQIFP